MNLQLRISDSAKALHCPNFERLLKILLIAIVCSITQRSLSQNAIVSENALPGTPAAEWDISGAGDLTIQGFATDISYNRGETAYFKIKTDAPAYTVTIYRLGYYQGNGARLIGTATITAGLPQIQPDDIVDAETGLRDCGNWNVSAEWSIPSNAVSGIYIAKLVRSDNGGASHIVFIVRDDSSNSDLLFQTSDATWQAYNVYGGNSLYVGNTSYPSGHAVKVSYNRPFVTRNGGGGGGAEEDWLFNAEYPMLRWLERNGYDVTYTTNVDADRRGHLIQNHRVFVSVGHDEYWSAAHLDNVVAARNSGVHLAFFSGNEVYWKTRWEPSVDGSSTPYRTLVCYKEGTLGENACGGKCDPLPGVWTGLWRDGCDFPLADGCLPENSLTGQISWDDVTGSIEVPASFGSHRFWRNTDIANLQPGETASLPYGTLGYEWNYEQYFDHYPAGRMKMSKTSLNSRVHQLSIYRHQSGALVFGAGTVQWSWGLDGIHDRGSSFEDSRMQQATVNLFADMGVQPATLQSNLIAATASSDLTAPQSFITSHQSGDTVSSFSTIVLSGTSSDNVQVWGVEVSVDGGTTWHPATGTTNWTYSWTTADTGTHTILSRGFDDSGNIGIAGNTVSVTVYGTSGIECPCTVFQMAEQPAVELANDSQPIEVGMKFRSSLDGYITGARYYRGNGNTGLHTAHLWSVDGSLLAEADFTSETSSGWQQVNFSTPVPITANTTYIISYYSSAGFYSYTDNYFVNAIVRGPLSALASGEDGNNGVYIYTPTPAFPTVSYQASNYWVDAIFTNSIGPDNTSPTVVSTTPAAGATSVSGNTTVSILFSEEMDPSTINGNTVELSQNGAPLSSSVTYISGSRKAILTPSEPLNYLTGYTATVRGGTGYDRVKDLAGNALAANYSWSFTTVAEPPPIPTDGPGGPVLVITSGTNPFSHYFTEILRAEGLNEFRTADVSEVDSSLLANYDVVILGEVNLSADHKQFLTEWSMNGGLLIFSRPDPVFASVFGLTPAAGTISDAYLKINTLSQPGHGITSESMQFHGTADLYNLSGATAIANIYSDANSETTYPAVSMFEMGTAGGRVIIFSFDLAKSVVYTRQGNPLWAGQKRDGQAGPIRSDDLFFGGASFDQQTDWVNLNKVAIPQADEQMRLLTNIIITYNLHRKPLPRFWFLPKGLKAAVVMTGDDHGNGGTVGRFNQYLSLSASNTADAVRDWTAIRGSSYIYPGTPITDAEAAAFEAQGFDIGIHLNTGCSNWTPASLELDYNTQLAALAAQLPSISISPTHRTHCIAWSDWATQAKIQRDKGIRLDLNYYYWPGSWILDRPGMFTGSGMPMRFADLDGSLIDCYQVATQMTDESGQTYPAFINSLLDKALGSEGYFGVFAANMHTDQVSSSGSDAIISSALARQVPVVSGRQMLKWLDARNASSFSALTWNGPVLSFTVIADTAAHHLTTLLPYLSGAGSLASIFYNGASIAFDTQTIKGILYAVFPSPGGNYEAHYDADEEAPLIISLIAEVQSSTSALVSWQTSENATTQIFYGEQPALLQHEEIDSALKMQHEVLIDSLTPGTTYYYLVKATDAFGNTAVSDTGSFTLTTSTCINDSGYTAFMEGEWNEGAWLSPAYDGIILRPSIAEEFESTPSAGVWLMENWSGGGSVGVQNENLQVDGAHLTSLSSFPSGSAIEFSANFKAQPFQNVGFSATPAFDAPWVTIGTNAAADGIYARTSDNVNFLISSAIGETHVFRLEWQSTGFNFYIDGNFATQIPFVITTPMVAQVSSFNVGQPLSLDWLYVFPVADSGTYVSTVYDAGSQTTWENVNWQAELPAGTSLEFYYRSGQTPVPDAGWSDFTQVLNSGDGITATSRYFQYRIKLATLNTSLTPVLHSVQINCSAVAGEDLVITVHPDSSTICSGAIVDFTTAAAGGSANNVKWQYSEDSGTNWNDIPSAINDTLSFTVELQQNGNLYRAIWSNGIVTDTSLPAQLSVNPSPDVTLVTPAQICQGGSLELNIDAVSGLSPFNLVVNGVPFTGIVPGIPLPIPHLGERTIWTGPETPANPDGSDGQSIETGVKFRTSRSGVIKGIRFYKGVTNTGFHRANLWTSTGTLLARGDFENETASGWQELRFTSPVRINANQTYIASYFSEQGGFAITPQYFLNASIGDSLIQALQAGVDGPNGVYRYGGGFPDNGNTANYWVDVIFEPDQIEVQTYNYVLSSVTDANNCSVIADTISHVVFQVNPPPSGILQAVSDTVCPGTGVQLVFNAVNGASPFTLVINDSTYTNVQDGIPFNSGKTVQSSAAYSLWSDTIVGGEPPTPDLSAIELGVRFRPATAGFIEGIRFYKRSANTGTHTGSLWSGTGTLLGTAIFTSETDSGWQRVYFPEPVPVEAGVDYVASYHAPQGAYAFTAGYFENAGYTNGALTALKSEPASGNGLYRYSLNPTFPNESFNHANYWVDVIFKQGNDNSFHLTGITDANGCTVSGSSLSSVIVESSELSIIFHSLIQPNCAGTSTGSFFFSANGGSAPYQYSIDGGQNFQSGDFINLPAGNYTVMVVDAAGCSRDTIINLTDPPVLGIQIVNQINNSCHGGSEGQLQAEAMGGMGTLSFTVSGPVVNNTGLNTGIFTGLSAGDYVVHVQDESGCAVPSDTVTITEPAGTLPDISLGSDISDNLLLGEGAETMIVFNVAEIAGNMAAGDTLRITRPAGYAIIFDNAATEVSINGTLYQLDNSRWSVASDAYFVSLILNNDAGLNNTISCGKRAYLHVKLKRATPNKSNFSLTAQLRRCTGEVNLINNNNALLIIAE